MLKDFQFYKRERESCGDGNWDCTYVGSSMKKLGCVECWRRFVMDNFAQVQYNNQRRLVLESKIIVGNKTK